MKASATPPLILLAEDDPVSAAFLREALRALPARVELATDAASARHAAAVQAIDLLLLDAHLPDASGIALLGDLRRQGCVAPALAHTASREESLHAQLHGAGFGDVLVKPLAVAALHDAVRQALELPPARHGGKRPLWDDAAAVATLGQPQHVAGMRQLFLSELPAQRDRIEAAASSGDRDGMRAELHRLTASCGFVGAARLAAAVQAVHADPDDPAALQMLRDAIADTASGG